MTKPRILVVEDEAITAKDLQQTLQELGYSVTARVSSAEDAIQQAEATRPDLVLMDVMLAGEMDGIEAAQKIGERFGIPVVYLTAHANEDTVRRAALTGPYGYVVKPFNDKDLRSNIEIALYKAAMERQVRESSQRLERNLHGMIELVSALIRMHDPRVYAQQEKVVSLACAIAGQLGLSPHTIEGLELSARIKGLGLLSVPSEVLAQADRLTGPLLRLYQQYPETGYDLLKTFDFPWPIAQIVLQQRELLDGSGFPRGLKGDAILLEAGILAVADVVAAMITRQPHSPALGIDAALDEIANNSGKRYDAQVAAACLRLFREKGYVLPE